MKCGSNRYGQIQATTSQSVNHKFNDSLWDSSLNCGRLKFNLPTPKAPPSERGVDSRKLRGSKITSRSRKRRGSNDDIRVPQRKNSHWQLILNGLEGFFKTHLARSFLVAGLTCVCFGWLPFWKNADCSFASSSCKDCSPASDLGIFSPIFSIVVQAPGKR